MTIVKSAAQKSNVKIVVADEESFMRDIVVNALTSGGYREIRSIAKLVSLQDVIESIYPDLVILSGEMADGDAVDFVRRIRLHRIGRNPFVPVILTAWNAEQGFVRKVVDSGADILVMKPFAAGQLFARIDFLASERPRFVVTSSYIGPDRRKVRRGDECPSFDPPNTLKERLAGRLFDPEDLVSRITKLFPPMMRQRQHFQEQELGVQFAAIAKATREQRAVAEIAGVIAAIAASAAIYAGEMAMAHGKGDVGQAKELAQRLQAIADAGLGFSAVDCEAVGKILDALGIMVPRSPAPHELPGDGDGVSAHSRPAA